MSVRNVPARYPSRGARISVPPQNLAAVVGLLDIAVHAIPFRSPVTERRASSGP